MVDRTRREFSKADVDKIAETYRAWRAEGEGEYKDQPGFCRSVEIAEIKHHNYVLTPGRYVGAAAENIEETSFSDRLTKLQLLLQDQFAQSATLTNILNKELDEVLGDV